MKHTTLIIFLGILLSATSVQSATYFVSPSGTNGAAGTLENPLFLIQEAIDLCAAGNDTVYLLEGTYWQHFVFADKANIYLSSLDPLNKSTISGSGVSGLHQVEIVGSTNIHIANIIFREHYVQDANAIYTHTSGDGLYITDNEFYNIGWGDDPSADPESFDPVGQSHAILVNGRNETGITNVYIGRNHFHDIVVGNSECITLTGNTSNFLIEDNLIEDITNIGIDIAGHFSWALPPEVDQELNQARSGRIRRNVVRRCRRPTPGNEPAGIYVDGGANVIIDRNEVYDNGTGVSIGCENFDKTATGITVANNLVYGNDKFGAVLGANAGNLENTTVRNNTFFDNGISFDNSGSIAIQKSTNSFIADNIVYITSEDYYGISAFGYLVDNLMIVRNQLFSTAGETPRVFAFSPAEGSTSSIDNLPFQDPLLVSTDPAALDFGLQDESPCIDQGNPFFSLLPEELDFYGNERLVQFVDIGAAESSLLSSVKDAFQVEISVYPNPTKAYVTVQASSMLRAFRVYSLLGSEIAESGQSRDGNVIDLSALAPGTYMLEMEFPEGKTVRRVVVQ